MRLFVFLLLTAPLLASCAPSRPDEKHNKHNKHGKDHSNNHPGGPNPKPKPKPPTSCPSPSPTPTSTPPASSTSCTPLTTPTKAYTITASAPSTAIDQLPLQAGSLGFHLGGAPSSYCPSSVGPSCPPPTNSTVFVGGSISVLVPGGQQQYTEPGGRLGYTQAHSLYMPAGSIPGGFNYAKCPGEEWGRVGTSEAVFGATGFMACPDGGSGGEVQYKVFVRIPDAVVPGGDVGACIPFEGLTRDYDGVVPAAWQYT